MSEIRHNPETGQHFIFDPGMGEWNEISKDAAQAAERAAGQGSFANAWDAFKNSSERVGYGVGSFSPDPVARENNRAAFDRLSQEQQGRSEQAPVSSFVGDVAPDVALGAITGGTGSLGMQAVRAGVTEAALGAVRNPDAPVQGAVTQGALGAGLVPAGSLIGRGYQSAKQFMSEPAARIVSSAEQVASANRAATGPSGPSGRSFTGEPGFTPGGPGGASGAVELSAGARFRQQAENVLFPDADPKVKSIEAADRLGIPLSPGMRRGSQAQQVAEEGMVRQPGALEVFNREIAEPTEDAVTNYVRRAFGLEDGTKLTRDDFAKGSDAIGAEFQQIAEDIHGRYLVTNDDVKQMKNVIRGSEGTRNEISLGKVERSWIDPFIKEDGGGELFQKARLDARDIWGIVRELNTEIAETNSDGMRRALTSLRDFWEDRFFNMAGGDEASKDIAARIKNANEKYRVQKLLESSGVMRGEEVNYKILANAAQRQFKPQMMRNDFSDARGRRLEPDTVNLIEALQVIRDFPSLLGNSGTPTGAAMMGGTAKALTSIAKSKAGAELYFGGLRPGAGKRAAVAAATSPVAQWGIVGSGAGFAGGLVGSE